MSDIRNELQSSLGSAYTLERELGGGGMSRVFVAEETALGRKVVVKVLSPELLAGVNIDRFKREIQLAAGLQQAQIVPVLAAGESNGVPYYTMPFVEGESLREKLARHEPFTIQEVVGILRDVARALAYAHERGIVHRDIKPDNVLLSGGTAVVTDFGIAKALSAAKTAPTTDGALTQLGMTVGTPTYISPEQAAGDPDVDARSDIYSLGCMAYELLSGRPPFTERTPHRLIVAHLTENPAPIAELRADVPSSLATLVMRMLEKDPSARPQTAAEVASGLDAMTSGSFSSDNGFLGHAPSGKAAVGVYIAASVIVALLAKAAVVAFGLPDWVFVGALTLMIIGLPAAMVAASGHRHVTWSRTVRAVSIALGAFATAVVSIMVLRLFGVGPAASLLAAGKLTGSARLIVVDFNAGNDSSLSHVVTEAVRTNLGQSKVVSIMPPAAITAALARMQRAPSTPVDLKLAEEIAQREGARAIVAGDITPLGGGYVVSIRLVSADSGAELAAYRTSVDGPGNLLDAIDGLTRKLRGRIGESLKAVRDAPPLDQVTTGSLDALRKYAEASRAFDLTGDYTTAVQLLRDAVKLDTGFAMAYRKLGVGLSNLGMPRAQVDSALTRAYQFRDRLPEKEKYLAIAAYYSPGPGFDRTKAIEAYRQALLVDSTNIVASHNLAGLLSGQRQFARAESLYRALNRSSTVSQSSLAGEMNVYIAQGKIDQADSMFRELAHRFPNAQATQVLPPTFMYMRGQIDSSEGFWRARVNDPNPLIRIAAQGNLTSFALLHGRIEEAQRLSARRRALNAARGVPANPLADSLVSAAISIWYLGDFEKGVRALDQIQASTPMTSLPIEQRQYFTMAKYYAWADRPDKARAMLAKYDAEVKNPQLRRVFSASVHDAMADILIAEKKPTEAIREIWRSDSLPDGPNGSCAHCLDFDLGRAYDLANQPDSAIAHWERYLAEPFTREVSRDGPVLAGVHKRLGEIYEAKGDLAKAESHFTSFVALWSNADPRLQPKVAEVKRRLAAVRARMRS